VGHVPRNLAANHIDAPLPPQLLPGPSNQPAAAGMTTAAGPWGLGSQQMSGVVGLFAGGGSFDPLLPGGGYTMASQMPLDTFAPPAPIHMGAPLDGHRRPIAAAAVSAGLGCANLGGGVLPLAPAWGSLPPPTGQPSGGVPPPLVRSRSAASLSEGSEFDEFASAAAALAASGSGRRRRLPTGSDDRRVAATPTSRQGPSRLNEAGASGASAPMESTGNADGGAEIHAGGSQAEAGDAAVGQGGGRAGVRGGSRGIARGGGRGGGRAGSHIGAGAVAVGAEDAGVESAPSQSRPPAFAGRGRGRGRGRRGGAVAVGDPRPSSAAGTETALLARMMETEANGLHPVSERLLYSVVLDLKRMRADGEIMRTNTAAAKDNSALAVRKADECIQAQKDMFALNTALVARLAAVEDELKARNLASSAGSSPITGPATMVAQPVVLRPWWAYQMQVRSSIEVLLLAFWSFLPLRAMLAGCVPGWHWWKHAHMHDCCV